MTTTTVQIIETDNFNRDNTDEILVADNVHPYYSKIICEALNKKHSGHDSQTFFKIESSDYKLFIFDPNS